METIKEEKSTIYDNLDENSKLYILSSVYLMNKHMNKQLFLIEKCLNKYYTKGLI